MAWADRHYLAGPIWHLTHRCHHREFLLKLLGTGRPEWGWLFEASKRFGLCVLNYVVTSNHIHLLVYDWGRDVIPNSMQLVAGQSGQKYNQRKQRKAYLSLVRPGFSPSDARHGSRFAATIGDQTILAGAVSVSWNCYLHVLA
jgi:putative transposase